MVLAALSAIALRVTAAEKGQDVPYPEGYRRWTFLHSMMMPQENFNKIYKKSCEKPCISGLHQFYANDKAMEGLRTGTYPDGAILADEIMEWLSTSSGGAKEGERVVTAVMVRDGQRYSSTGGWGWGVFTNGSKVDQADAKTREACQQCHGMRKDQGYVYTEYKER
jgi:hypothetical protein